MLQILAFLKAIHDNGASTMSLSVAALSIAAWYEFVDKPAVEHRVSGVEVAVTSIQVGQLEQRLDQTYAALCMNPGDSALLERVRDLQQKYFEVSGRRYNAPSCDLLLKIK